MESRTGQCLTVSNPMHRLLNSLMNKQEMNKSYIGNSMPNN
uniref:Uncharacterized protein n=1 Tax=Arundo donax TaxID=35708 RepID=A0A0A9FE98_ARUDO